MSTPDAGAIIAAYRAKFDNWPSRDGGPFAPETPLKAAAQTHSIPELLEQIQSAIESGRPMDFAHFAVESLKRWASTDVVAG